MHQGDEAVAVAQGDDFGQHAERQSIDQNRAVRRDCREPRESLRADSGIWPWKTLAEIEHRDRSRQPLELGNHPPVVGVTAGRGRQIARNGKNERASHCKFAS